MLSMTGNVGYTSNIWLALAVAIFVAATGVYSWRHRDVPGATLFAASSLFVVLTVLATAAETISHSAPTKIAWYKFQVVWQIAAATCLTGFTLDYVWPNRWLTRRTVILLVIPLLLVTLLVIVDDGRLMWRLLEVIPAGWVVPHLTAIGALVVAYGIGLGLLSAAALLWLFVRSPQHRWPAVLILGGLAAGRGVFLAGIAGVPRPAGIDPLVMAYLVAWAAYAIAVFGFHILDPWPTARTVAIEQMQEGMVILDVHGCVANLNPAAMRMLSTSVASARGKSLPALWPAFSDLNDGSLGVGSSIVRSGAQGTVPCVIELDLENASETRRLALDCSALEDFRGLRIGHLLMLRDVTEQRRAQECALEQQRTLAVLRERERLARELHDNLGQVLAFVHIQGQTVRRLLSQGETAAADEQVGRLIEVAREADTDIRESILGLRVALAEQGFLPALATFLDQYERRYGIRTAIRWPETLGQDAFDPLVEVQLLRIIQEALTNARKHARAGSVCVTFAADGDRAQVTVQDDGLGFEPDRAFDESAGRVGLRVMRERAEEIGGTVTVQSASGEGTQVVVTAPLAHGRGSVTNKEGDRHARAVG